MCKSNVVLEKRCCLKSNVVWNLERFVLKKNTRSPKAQGHTGTTATCHSMRRLKRCATRTRQAGWTWAACWMPTAPSPATPTSKCCAWRCGAMQDMPLTPDALKQIKAAKGDARTQLLARSAHNNHTHKALTTLGRNGHSNGFWSGFDVSAILYTHP